MDFQKLNSSQLYRIETLFYQAGIKELLGKINIKKRKFLILFILHLIFCLFLLILYGYLYFKSDGKLSPLYFYGIGVLFFVGSIFIYRRYDYKGDSRMFDDKSGFEATKITSKINPKAYKVIDESIELFDIDDVNNKYLLGLEKISKRKEISQDINDYSNIDLDDIDGNKEKLKKYFYDCYLPITDILGKLLKSNLLENLDIKYFDNIINYKFITNSGEEKNIVGFNYWTYFYTYGVEKSRNKNRRIRSSKKVKNEVDNVGFLLSNSSYNFKKPLVVTYKYELDDKKFKASICGGIIIFILWFVLLFKIPIANYLLNISELLGGPYVFIHVFIAPYFVIKYFNKFLVQFYLEKIKGIGLDQIKDPVINITITSDDDELKQKFEQNIILKNEIHDLAKNGFYKFNLIFIDNKIFLNFTIVSQNELFFNYDFGKNLEKNILRYQIQGNRLKKILNFMKKMEEIL